MEIRQIPVLTQAEVESIRQPDDIIKIVAGASEREYVPVPDNIATTKRRRHTRWAQVVIAANHPQVQSSQLSAGTSLLTPVVVAPSSRLASPLSPAKTPNPIIVEPSIATPEWVYGGVVVLMALLGIGLFVKYKRLK